MPQQTTLPTAVLKPDPNQPRKSRDDEKLRRLTESVRLLGVLQPIGVRSDRTTVVWGHGRLLAAIAAGLKDIPVIILDKPMTEGEYLVLQLVENTLRSDLSDYEQWRGCADALLKNPKWQLKDLAEMLSLDPSSLTRIMSPSKCIPAVVDALRDGKILFAHTYAISKAETPEEQARLLSLALAGTSRAKIEAERAGRKGSNATASAVKVLRVKIAMPEGASVVISGKELSMAEVVELLGETLKEARKAADQYDVKTWVSMMRDKAKAAG
jgi:ParB family transcriptional regulator, chromosome partitioning protein